jgi:hypothetical protein
MGFKKTGKIITCQFCNKEFYIPLNRFDTAKFCSCKCRGMSAFKDFEGVCNICGKLFSYKACREGKAKYCSRKCYYKAQTNKGKTIKKCKYCGKEFKSALSHGRKFCSQKCFSENIKKTRTGNFQCVRSAMKRRGLINKCYDCGYNEHPEILQVHHKNGNRNKNSIHNLVVLCPNCHSLRHKKHIPH